MEIPAVTDGIYHAGLWAWKTDVYGDPWGERVATSQHVDAAIIVSGCGYDVGPNCMPGHCLQTDEMCWTCTSDEWVLDPDFVPPTCEAEAQTRLLAEQVVGSPWFHGLAGFGLGAVLLAAVYRSRTEKVYDNISEADV